MNTTTVYDTLLTDNSILSIDIPVYNPEFEGEDFGFHLVYQYNIYANYDDEELNKKNPEIATD